MTCQDARLKLSWWLDGELDEAGVQEVREHLASCEACAAVHREMGANDERIRETLADVGPPRRMKGRIMAATRKSRGRWPKWIATAAALLVTVVGLGTAYVNSMSPPPLVVQMYGGESFHADSMGALRVFVTNAVTQLPIEEASVQVSLAGAEVGKFVTTASGSIDGYFKVPDVADGTYPLSIRVDSPVGSDVLVRDVMVRREYKLLLTTDKPMYQPGQTIHLRALALNSFTLKPRPGDAQFEVLDSKGNRVYRKPVKLSEYGIGSADFELADEVNLGTYRIAVTASGLRQERTVEVARYVLPKFKVELELQKRSYRPREVVRGTVRAKYFFGKPVHGTARVAIGREVVSGELRPDGTWEFQAPAPAVGTLVVDAKVTDTADHVETKTTAVVVSTQPLDVRLVPEGGKVVHAVENVFYVIVSTPDGRPAKAELSLQVNGKAVGMSTDDLGVAMLTVKPPFNIRLDRARDGDGNVTSVMRDLKSYSTNDFLIRLDKPAYKGGETMNIRVLRSSPGPVYVDLVKGGQLILAKAVMGETLAVDLPPDLFGTVQVIAYRKRSSQPSVRVAYVNLPEGLRIRPRVAKETFRPGEEMPVEFEVVDRDGKPVQAALGVAVVDEALFGLVASKLASEKAWLSLAPELINTRGFLKADAAEIYLEGRANAQAFVCGNGEGTRSGLLAENPWQQRAAEVKGFIAEYNDVLIAAGKVFGYMLAIVLAAWMLYGIVRFIKSLSPVGRAGLIFFVVGVVAMGLIMLLLTASGGADFAPMAGMEAAPDMAPVPMAPPPAPMPAMKKPVARSLAPAPRPSPSKPPQPDPQAAPVRIREYFPETLFWMPQLITDANGKAKLTLPAADSITSWRLMANAISKGGALGYQNADLRVFQDFFADIDFPVALTKGDKVHVPVAVYNYLKQAQTVTVRVEEEPWFELLDAGSKKIDLKAGEVSVVYFGLKVKEHGRKSLTVFADGNVKDAIRRTVDVMEKGREIPVSESARVNGARTFEVEIPDRAIEGASLAFVRVSPGVSDLVTGLEGMIRLPYG